MNDHDIDIILALAEGRLSGADAAEARARVEADPELAAELDAQIAAIDALAASPTPSLTASERTDLRTNLIAALHLEAEPSPSAVPARAWSWRPVLFGLASAAALVLAVVVLPNVLSSSSSDEAAFAPAADTAVATQDGAADASELPETSIASQGAGAPPVIAEVPEVSKQSMSDLVEARSGASPEADALDESAEINAGNVTLVDLGALASCIEELDRELADGAGTPIAATTTDDGQIVYLEGSTGSLVAIDLGTCSFVDLAP